jgi:hypothetical protein
VATKSSGAEGADGRDRERTFKKRQFAGAPEASRALDKSAATATEAPSTDGEAPPPPPPPPAAKELPS